MCKKERMLLAAFKEVDLERNRHNLIAILEKGGNILAIGKNDMSKSHPAYFNGSYDKSIHAEYAALRQVREADGANLFVFYFKRAGGLGNSKPCRECYDLISNRGINKVFYIKDGKFKQETLYNNN